MFGKEILLFFVPPEDEVLLSSSGWEFLGNVFLEFGIDTVLSGLPFLQLFFI